MKSSVIILQIAFLVCSIAAFGQVGRGGSPIPPIHDLQFVSESKWYAADKIGLWLTENSGTTWQLALKTPDSDAAWHGVSCMSFPDERNGFVVADQKLYSTSDGNRWQFISGLSDTVSSCFFLDSQHGWISSSKWPRKDPPKSIPTISKSGDGGRTWKEQWRGNFGLSDKPLVRSMFFVDSLHGWAVGDQIILRTEDGGDTWIPRSSRGDEFIDVEFSSEKYGWISAGSSSTYLVTTTGGTTWSSAPMPRSDDSGPVRLVKTPSQSWVAYGKELSYSADGRNWIRIHIDDVSDWQWVRAFRSGVVIAVGEKYLPAPALTFATSYDGGRTWSSLHQEASK